MGRDPASSVVDSRGRSHAVRDLLIADASVYPTSLGVNPQLTTMAAGTLIARRLVEDA
jgi:choline dehydrogenase-like flavoprotein